ncbi:MAG: hypothetical protein RL386_1238, partial [Bacteroidota bacterium]
MPGQRFFACFDGYFQPVGGWRQQAGSVWRKD